MLVPQWTQSPELRLAYLLDTWAPVLQRLADNDQPFGLPVGFDFKADLASGVIVHPSESLPSDWVSK